MKTETTLSSSMVNWTLVCTSIDKAFPASDPLAMDLLRLMAGYNDLITLSDWVDANKDVPDDQAERTIAGGQHFLRLRFISAVFFEVLKVLAELQKEKQEFGKLTNRFGTEARSALKRLNAVRTCRDSSLRKQLDRTRNQVTFHYLRNVFAKGMNLFISEFGEKKFPIENRRPNDARRWYPLAEYIQMLNSFGIASDDTSINNFAKIVHLMDDLSCVLDASFQAYRKHRKLEQAFTTYERKLKQ